MEVKGDNWVKQIDAIENVEWKQRCESQQRDKNKRIYNFCVERGYILLII
jgi:hypothetical protein